MKSNIIDKTSLENFRGHNCFILNFYNFQTCTSTNFYGHINRYYSSKGNTIIVSDTIEKN